MQVSLESDKLELCPTQILIVEDERAVARDLKESLEHLGYRVPAIASSSDEAIEQVATLQPDLVLMDIVLEDSDRDGIDIAQEIHNRFGVPVVYLTAYATKTILDRVKATNPFGYLLKPFREKDLWVAIETALKRKSLEQVLHEREEWLSHILSSMRDGVIAFDNAFRIQFINPAAENLTGWAQADALNQPIQEVFRIVQEGTRATVIASLLQAVAQGELFYLGLDTLLITKSGQEIPIANSATPLWDQHSTINGGIIVFRDAYALRLTQERDLAIARSEQLELQMRELENLNRLKDDFLSTVSHELRTPLSNIKMATRMLTIVLDQLDLLAQSSGLSTTPISKHVNILQQETEQELNLINDLLDLQQIQAEAYTPEISVIHLQSWLPPIVSTFQLKAEENQQILQLFLPSDLPNFWTDAHALTRIISELLNNACKYTPSGQHIKITVEVRSDDLLNPKHWIFLEVCNSGVTLSFEEQKNIFEAFYRLPQSDRWKQGGTGLGLALVKKFTNLLGGRIEVNSSLTETCFCIFLPIQNGYVA